MNAKHRLRRLEAAHRRHRGDDDRIPVYIIDEHGKRIAGPHYNDNSGIVDYRHDLWMVTDDEQITNQ